jgi:hypothetical protein
MYVKHDIVLPGFKYGFELGYKEESVVFISLQNIVNKVRQTCDATAFHCSLARRESTA